MRHNTSQLARDGAVDGLCDAEICWEKNIEVSLMNLCDLSLPIFNDSGLHSLPRGL